MISYGIVTLAELKSWIPVTGSAVDSSLEAARGAATRMIEGYLGLRVVYRAPPADELPVLSAFTWPTGAGAPAITNQPNTSGRTLIVTWTTATAGTLTVTGTVDGLAGVTEVFDVVNGPVQYGVKFFTLVSALTIAAGTGGGTVAVTTSQGYVEYHFKPTSGLYTYSGYDRTGYSLNNVSELYLRARPVLNVLEVNEDSGRTWAVGTRLVNATDYVTNKGEGKLLRWSGTGPTAWPSGHRIVRVTYSAGYFTAANVPPDIKDVCLRLADRIYKEKSREGVSSYTDATGSVTRFGPAFLTKPMQEQLASYRRGPYDPSMTAEWDFDTEVA